MRFLARQETYTDRSQQNKLMYYGQQFFFEFCLFGFFWKATKIYPKEWELSQSVLRKLDSYGQKKETWLLFLPTLKVQIKVVKRQRCSIWNNEKNKIKRKQGRFFRTCVWVSSFRIWTPMSKQERQNYDEVTKSDKIK